MGLATITFVLFLLVVFYLTGRRNARRARTETPAQREKRIRARKDTAVILSILDDR
ncbi:MAG: hypothetical protein WA982_16090 [Rubrobacteraceae bacterium]